jgi:hypothetical protein
MQLTAKARARYDLHRTARARIRSDLGAPDIALNQKLTAWWALDFPAFRAELHKVFTRDIPLKDRDDACIDRNRCNAYDADPQWRAN